MDEFVSIKHRNMTFRSTLRQVLGDNLDLNFSVYYNKNPHSLLNRLCDQYGSDKGEIATSGHPYPWPSHTYADYIERCFGHCREHVRHVFECGVGTNNPSVPSSMGVNGRPGASLRVWRDYFPNARIYGADIDRDILFTEDRISTFHCDQTDKGSIQALWATIGPVQFDLMIDDGLHNFEAGVTLLENSIDRLKPGGLYVIEDVTVGGVLAFVDYLRGRHSFDVVNLYRQGAELGDNSLIVIRA